MLFTHNIEKTTRNFKKDSLKKKQLKVVVLLRVEMFDNCLLMLRGDCYPNKHLGDQKILGIYIYACLHTGNEIYVKKIAKYSTQT